MSIGLKQAIINPSITSILIIAITLTAGTVFLMWIGEQITAHGVGMVYRLSFSQVSLQHFHKIWVLYIITCKQAQ